MRNVCPLPSPINRAHAILQSVSELAKRGENSLNVRTTSFKRRLISELAIVQGCAFDRVMGDESEWQGLSELMHDQRQNVLLEIADKERRLKTLEEEEVSWRLCHLPVSPLPLVLFDGQATLLCVQQSRRCEHEHINEYIHVHTCVHLHTCIHMLRHRYMVYALTHASGPSSPRLRDDVSCDFLS